LVVAREVTHTDAEFSNRLDSPCYTGRHSGLEFVIHVTTPVKSPSVSIVIPIYRERAFLGQSLDAMISELRLHAVGHEIILVEQFSDELTLAESRAQTERHPSVRHLLLDQPDFGYAMRVGMLEARGDIIINFDIDYWDVTFARMCAAMMTEFDIDIVIGSKNTRLSVDNRAPIRRYISGVYRIVLQAVFGLRVSDTHGIKAWLRSPKLIELIDACHFTRDIFDTELVIRGERAGLRLLELPVTVAELRPPRTSILFRVPSAARNLARLFFVLATDSPGRSTPRGAIGSRYPQTRLTETDAR
jgi:glycosyltransferase involved in cell wall biosynthesis